MLYFYLILFVQIIVESFPISSSGHVTLITHLYEQYYVKQPILIPESFNAWFDSLHVITALIVALFFYKQWMFFLTHLVRTWRTVLKLIILTAAADAVTILWYLFFHYYSVEPSLLIGFCTTLFLLASLLLVSHSKKKRAFNIRDALLLGMVQGIALLPGISRFAATFVISRWLGYSNERAFQLSWMIQWPLVAAASLVGLSQLYASNMLSFYYSPAALVCMMIASVLSYYALAFAYLCAIKNTFWKFAYYMMVPIVLAMVV